MLFKSQVFTQASGSVGGLTYSRNSGGMYTRARSIPVNPATSQQQSVRNAMATLVGRYGGTLTQAQRDAWAVYALNTPVTNRLGDQVNISGAAMYTRSNIPRVQAALAVIDDAPTNFSLGDPPELGMTVDAANDEADVTFAAGAPWVNTDGDNALIYISRPQNPSIVFFKGPYRFAGLIAGDATTPPTSPAAITLPFAATAGQVFFLFARLTRADGRLSSPFRISGLAA